MTQVRLLPTVLIAVVGLLFIKVAHLVVYSDMSAVSTTPALAQEAPAPAADGGAAEEGLAMRRLLLKRQNPIWVKSHPL